jgi:prolyl oligopeptidase
MPKLMETPPHSPAEPVTEILHGTSVTDPYRWLEDQESSRTRAWIAAQTRFARASLDAIPVRDRIRERVRELLDVETYDSIQRVGNRYFFRKRLRAHEQPCIFFREGLEGTDQLLVDPDERGTGNRTALKLRQVSADGNLLLYEVKEGGERSGVFEVYDIKRRKTLPDILPRGYLRGFAFAPDGRSFYYVHDAVCGSKSLNRMAYQHLLGTALSDDLRIFSAGNAEGLQLYLVPGQRHLGFLVFHFLDKTYTDFYLWPLDGDRDAEVLLKNVEHRIGPLLLNDRILAVTDLDAPNSRIVEVRAREGQAPEFVDVIPQGDSPLGNWVVAANTIWVSYTRGVRTEVHVFDLYGKKLGHVPVGNWETVRLIGG